MIKSFVETVGLTLELLGFEIPQGDLQTINLKCVDFKWVLLCSRELIKRLFLVLMTSHYLQILDETCTSYHINIRLAVQ